MPSFDFSTPATGGWGSAWTPLGSDPTSELSVAGGVGLAGPVTANKNLVQAWNAQSYTNSEQAIEFSIDSLATGGDQHIGVCLCLATLDSTGRDNCYYARITWKPAGTVSFNWFILVGGVATSLIGNQITAIPAGQSWTLKARKLSTGLLARIWQTGTTEPLLWTFQTADATYPSGYGAVRVDAVTGNTNVPTGTFDNYSVSAVSAPSQVSFPSPGADPYFGIDLSWTDFPDSPTPAGMEECAEFLAAYTAVAGVPFMKVVGPAYDWPNPQFNGLGLCQYIIEQGGIPVVSWPRGVKPSDWITATPLGTYDDIYTNFANLAAALPGQWVWRFGWEMNALASQRTILPASAAVTLWRYVHDLVLPLAPNCLGMCWNVGLFANQPDAYYPGDAYVAYTGFDNYAQQPPVQFYDQCTNKNGNYYQKLMSIAPSKPMIIGEVGAREQDDPSIADQGGPQAFTKAEYVNKLRSQIRNLRTNYGGQIVGVHFFNESQGGLAHNRDWHVDTWPGHYGTLNDDPLVNPTVASWQALMQGTQLFDVFENGPALVVTTA